MSNVATAAPQNAEPEGEPMTDAPSPETGWTGQPPSALSAIWDACAKLAQVGPVIAEKMKVRRKQVLEKAETLEKSATRMVMELEENKHVGPNFACKDFASNGYLIGELLKIGIADEQEYTRMRDQVMSGMSGRRLIFEIELVERDDKDLMVAHWKKALADLTTLRETLAA